MVSFPQISPQKSCMRPSLTTCVLHTLPIPAFLIHFLLLQSLNIYLLSSVPTTGILHFITWAYLPRRGNSVLVQLSVTSLFPTYFNKRDTNERNCCCLVTYQVEACFVPTARLYLTRWTSDACTRTLRKEVHVSWWRDRSDQVKIRQVRQYLIVCQMNQSWDRFDIHLAPYADHSYWRICQLYQSWERGLRRV